MIRISRHTAELLAGTHHADDESRCYDVARALLDDTLIYSESGGRVWSARALMEANWAWLPWQDYTFRVTRDLQDLQEGAK